MARIGKELLLGAKAAVRASATEKGEIEKNNLHGRDLLSLLVKANMATDIPESQRLSDEDVLARACPCIHSSSIVPDAFLQRSPHSWWPVTKLQGIVPYRFTEHFGTGPWRNSTATTWALFAMTKAPEVQTKLRAELLSVDTETPSMDELMALPYLDAVVRETLRIHSPVANTLRTAMKDDVLPVEKPYTDKNGMVHDSIRYASCIFFHEFNVYPSLFVQNQQRRFALYSHPGNQPVAGAVGA